MRTILFTVSGGVTVGMEEYSKRVFLNTVHTTTVAYFMMILQ